MELSELETLVKSHINNTEEETIRYRNEAKDFNSQTQEKLQEFRNELQRAKIDIIQLQDRAREEKDTPESPKTPLLEEKPKKRTLVTRLKRLVLGKELQPPKE